MQWESVVSARNQACRHEFEGLLGEGSGYGSTFPFIVGLFFVACDPQQKVTVPSVSTLNSTEKTTLLSETLFAFEYSITVLASQQRSDDDFQGEYTLNEAYATAYKAKYGNNPTYITAGSTLTVVLSINDESHLQISVSVAGSSGVSGTVDVAIAYNTTTEEISCCINGSPIDATGIDLPNFGELLIPPVGPPPKTYFRVQFLNTKTDEVVHELELDYNISNFAAIENSENFEAMAYDSLIYREVEILIDGEPSPGVFILTTINREITPSEVEGSIPSDLSLTSIYISNFTGVGTYQSKKSADFDPETDSMISIITGTNQNNIASPYNLAVYVYIQSEEDEITVEISRYDEIGGIIEGTITVNNITMYYINFKEDMYDNEVIKQKNAYNLAMEFSMVRGDDLTVNCTVVNFMDGEENPLWSDLLIIGETYTSFLEEDYLHSPPKKFNGWSTEPNGKGTVYSVGGSIVIPAGGMTLYAVWEDIN